MGSAQGVHAVAELHGAIDCLQSEAQAALRCVHALPDVLLRLETGLVALRPVLRSASQARAGGGGPAAAENLALVRSQAAGVVDVLGAAAAKLMAQVRMQCCLFQAMYNVNSCYHTALGLRRISIACEQNISNQG